MAGLITNRAELVSHGDRAGRALALDILEGGLAAADPYANTLKLIRREGDRLLIGGHPHMDVSGYGDETLDELWTTISGATENMPTIARSPGVRASP